MFPPPRPHPPHLAPWRPRRTTGASLGDRPAHQPAVPRRGAGEPRRFPVWQHACQRLRGCCAAHTPARRKQRGAAASTGGRGSALRHPHTAAGGWGAAATTPTTDALAAATAAWRGGCTAATPHPSLPGGGWRGVPLGFLLLPPPSAVEPPPGYTAFDPSRPLGVGLPPNCLLGGPPRPAARCTQTRCW